MEYQRCPKCKALHYAGEPHQCELRSWRDGWPGVVLALVAGPVVFVSWVVLGVLPPGRMVPHPLVTFFPFVYFVGIGPVAAVVMTWLAPKRRWVIAAPLVVLIHTGLVCFALGMSAAFNSNIPQGLTEGTSLGILVGLALIHWLGRRWSRPVSGE